MELIEATEKDYETCKEMLIQEGINKEEEMSLGKGETWLLKDDGFIKGFFTFQKAFGRPYLIHFCVGRKYRSPFLFRRLARGFKEMQKKRGYRDFITNAPKRNVDLTKFLRTYFRKKEYAEKDNQYYFIANT